MMRALVFVVFSWAFVGNIFSKRHFRCDYTYVPEVNGWLKLHEMPSIWSDARLRCEMEGAVIASPTTLTMKSAMTDFLKKFDTIFEHGIFTGIHAFFSKGDFASIEGVPLEKIPHTWAIGEPDNKNNEENCLNLLPGGEMSDVRCIDAYPYLCYKNKSSMVVTSCGTVDTEYTLDTRTGQCYKFHGVPRTWKRAYMHCMAEGGYLTIINSDTEATVIRELFAKHPASSMIGPFWKDIAFVGFHDWNEHGSWRTIHGQTLSEAGYDKFTPGQPDNLTTGEYCGAVFRTALFDDLWCENSYAFICEKEPDSLLCDDDDFYETNL